MGVGDLQAFLYHFLGEEVYASADLGQHQRFFNRAAFLSKYGGTLIGLVSLRRDKILF